MNVSELMTRAKAGLLNEEHVRPMNDKATVNDIRKSTEAMLRKSGFPKYAQLGSGNAISDSAKNDFELEIEIELPGQDAAPAAPAAPAGPAPPDKPILPGRPQSDASKAVKPSHRPPYYLDSSDGKKQMAEYQGYLVDRYGSTEGRKLADELETDSKGFTKAFNMQRDINKKITAFNKDQAGQWKQWANNVLVEYGNDIIDIFGDLGKKLAPQGAYAIDKISGILKRFKPTEMQDFSKAMLEVQAKLWEGRPEWKAKLNELLQPELEKLKKKAEDMSWREDESKGKPFEGLY